MEVNYRWSFLVGDAPCVERKWRQIPAQTYTVVEEKVTAKDEREEEIALVKAVRGQIERISI